MPVERQGPWQRPGYKGDDIYPGFGCSDDMRAGGVNIGGTRLLVHDILWSVVAGGWDKAVNEYAPACDTDQYRRFLHDLLDARGEFGRLLLTIAAAERAERDRDEAGHCDVSWWEDPELSAPVVEQLFRCLRCLDAIPSPGGVSSVAEAPPQGPMSRLQEAVAAAHDSGASAVTVDLPTGDDLLRLLAEAPPPQVLTDLEQQVVRSAADWLEQRGNYAAHPDLHSGMLALLMIIDRFCRHGAVRLDEGPAEATEGEALCGDPSCVCHEEGDDSDG